MLLLIQAAESKRKIILLFVLLISCSAGSTDDRSNSNLTASASDPLPTNTTMTNISTTETHSTAEAYTTTAVPMNTTGSSNSTGNPNPPVNPTKQPSRSNDSYNPIYCLCDLQVASCDMNCCCDPDCNEDERAVFSSCDDPDINNSGQGQRHCHRRDYVYRNNTPFYMEVHQSGLFCIVTPNINEQDQFPALQIDALKALNENIPHYSWIPELQGHTTSAEASREYTFASKIQTVKILNVTTQAADGEFLWIPSGFIGASCTAKQPVQFLQDTTTTCRKKVSSLSSQCSNVKIFDVTNLLGETYIIRNPRNNLTRDNLVNFVYKDCQNVNLEDTCLEVLLPKSPSFDQHSERCNNVAEIVNLVFVHLGVEGIVSATAKIQYKNYSKSSHEIIQEFRTRFEWSNKKQADEDYSRPPYFEKSGNPGYLVGKPVIMGTAISQEVSSNETREDTEEDDDALPPIQTGKRSRVLQSSDQRNNWLTVQSPGVCGESRKPVLFGMDTNVLCSLDITKFKSCQELQYEIGKILLGIPPSKFKERYVSSYGNPTFDILENWVQILPAEHPFGSEESSSFTQIDTVGCEGIISSLHIPIIFLRVGSVHFPQSKIVSLVHEYGQPINIPKKTLRGNTTRFVVSSTVRFMDATKSPVTKIPQWPVISIKLPADFFYPFSSYHSNGNKALVCVWPVLIVVSLVSILFY